MNYSSIKLDEHLGIGCMVHENCLWLMNISFFLSQGQIFEPHTVELCICSTWGLLGFLSYDLVSYGSDKFHGRMYGK